MNTADSFRFLGFRRKLEVLVSVVVFFELYSKAMEGKKDKKRTENNFFSESKKFKPLHNTIIPFVILEYIYSK